MADSVEGVVGLSPSSKDKPVAGRRAASVVQPEGKSPDETWHCEACTFVNGPLLPSCEMCSTTKPQTQTGSASLTPKPRFIHRQQSSGQVAARQVSGHDLALTSKVAEALRASEGVPCLPVQLNYLRDQGETIYGSSDPSDKRVTAQQRDMAQKAHCSADVDMHNGRKAVKPLTLFQAGFELRRHQTRLAEKAFTGAGGMKEGDVAAYKREQEVLVQSITGAKMVRAFHTNVRNADPTDKKKEKPAYGVHCDYSTKTAMKLFDDIASGENRSGGRFIIVNTWRSVDDKHPIMDDPLACADARSIIGPDDYVPKVWYQGASKNYNYGLDPSRRQYHRWYYFPKMVKEEVLVFLQYDSDPLSMARYCFHSALPDPALPRAATKATGSKANPPIPYRKSIETRLIAFFPDHRPSTIPSFVLSENELVEAVCEKMMNALGYPTHWGAGQAWMKTNLPKGGKGARYLVTELVKGGVTRKEHGLEQSSAEQRARIIDQLLAKGEWEKKAKRNFLC